jgi:monoterpene epsilon-lactone hydrolase
MAIIPLGRMLKTAGAIALMLAIAVSPGRAQQSHSAPGSQVGTSTVDPDGTAHITRVVPVPPTISSEAQKYLATPPSSQPAATLAERRASTDAWRERTAEKARQLYPVKSVEKRTLGGVRTDIITPLTIPEEKRNRVLINVHGGGFVTDAGSLVEGIPISNLTQTTVVSVYYRLAPEHPFPAAVDDTVTAYKELLKTHKPQDMALYGTSAGAILTAEVAVRLRNLGLPLPAALGIFSGTGDMSGRGDSTSLFTLRGLWGNVRPPSRGSNISSYVGGRDPKDPVLSPLYADLKGFPPALFITSTRDFLLSGTTILHRAFLRAGVDAQLVVFEALPHGFWNEYDLPESREALGIVAKFFNQKVGAR